jgi:hypothetical protein
MGLYLLQQRRQMLRQHQRQLHHRLRRRRLLSLHLRFHKAPRQHLVAFQEQLQEHPLALAIMEHFLQQ